MSLYLSSTTDKIQVVTSGTADIHYITEYGVADTTTPPVIAKTFDTKVGAITTATTTDISGSPAAANDRWNITSIDLRNAHASASNDVTVQYVKAGGTARDLIKATLAAGEKLIRSKDGVWFVYDATGGVKTAVAAAMRRVVLTSGTAATYTTPAGCRAIDVECIGAGGAGGSSAGAASSAGAGAGGGSGGYTRDLISPPAASYTYTVGAGGTPGASGNNAGGAGADTTFGGLTAKGGSGGAGSGAAAATALVTLAGAGGVAGSGGDINGPGMAGEPGLRFSATIAQSGDGGATPRGGGARGNIAHLAGNAATANTGGGGSGALSLNVNANFQGGAGGSGVIIVTEFY